MIYNFLVNFLAKFSDIPDENKLPITSANNTSNTNTNNTTNTNTNSINKINNKTNNNTNPFMGIGEKMPDLYQLGSLLGNIALNQINNMM